MRKQPQAIVKRIPSHTKRARGTGTQNIKKFKQGRTIKTIAGNIFNSSCKTCRYSETYI